MDAATPLKETHASAQPRPAKVKSFWHRREHALIGTVSMLAFLGFWELSVALNWVNPLFTSSPSRIVRTGYEMFAEGGIWYDIQVSGYEFIVGYGAAIVIGVPLGILMGWYSRVDAVLDPFVSALYATPRIALLPLVMIWFGYGIARRIEQTSNDLLSVNYGTLYPALLKLEQEGYIAAEWGVSDNNRKAKFYSLTRAGRKQLEKEAREWQRTTGIIARFFSTEEQ